jgi:hypothetical protein
MKNQPTNNQIPKAISYVEKEIRALLHLGPYHHNCIEAYINLENIKKTIKNEELFRKAISVKEYQEKTWHPFFKNKINIELDLFSNLPYCQKLKHEKSLFTSMEDYLFLLKKYGAGDCIVQSKSAFSLYPRFCS